MARRGACGRCGSQRRGRRRYVASWPVADCSRCDTPVCDRHLVRDYSGNRDLCTKCARDLGVKVVR